MLRSALTCLIVFLFSAAIHNAASDANASKLSSTGPPGRFSNPSLNLSINPSQPSAQYSASTSKKPSIGCSPVVMAVFDENCKIWCDRVRPVMRALAKEYEGKVVFVELDASDHHLNESKRRARQLGYGRHFVDALEYVPDVMIFDTTRKMVRDLSGPKNKSEYKSAINLALMAR